MVNKNVSEVIEVIKNSTNEILPGSRILLFGSRARQENSKDSDYDFMVITKDTLDINQKRFLQSQLRKKLAQHGIPADILIQSDEEIITKKEVAGHIVREIIKEGVAI
jgi:uncharacterized protein